LGRHRVWPPVLHRYNVDRVDGDRHGPKSDAMSRYFLDAQVNATILASEAEGLENVHWARIEYVTEVELCTKWLLFRYVSLLVTRVCPWPGE